MKLSDLKEIDKTRTYRDQELCTKIMDPLTGTRYNRRIFIDELEKRGEEDEI